MNFFRVERNVAVMLFLGAIAGLVLANSAGAHFLEQLKTFHLGFGSVSTTLEEWLHNYGIPAFFALVGLELRREFHSGLFVNRKAIVVPALAATLGVVVPALVYLLIVGVDSSAATGWPIPTATDVTFSLAVFLLFGKKLPPSARIFLLAFAIIDDLIGIVVITVLYAQALHLAPTLIAALALVLFMAAGLAHSKAQPKWLKTILTVAMCGLALMALNQTVASGIQPTLTGVLIGLLVPIAVNPKVEHALHPWISGIILPVFAVMATGVTLSMGSVGSEPVFWAILSRPVTKAVGISLGAYVAIKVLKLPKALAIGHIMRVSVLGGIGFTVSLLITQIAFQGQEKLQSEAVAATLLASAISMIIGAIALLSAHGSESRNRP